PSFAHVVAGGGGPPSRAAGAAESHVRMAEGNEFRYRQSAASARLLARQAPAVRGRRRPARRTSLVQLPLARKASHATASAYTSAACHSRWRIYSDQLNEDDSASVPACQGRTRGTNTGTFCS